MENELKADLQERISKIFKDFLTRVTKLEELADIGRRLLTGYQQALEFLRRPALDKTSDILRKIIKANETKRVRSYIDAGCVNVHNSIQNTNKLRTCLLGLHDHLSKAKSILNELQHLLEDLSSVIQTANECLSPLKNEDCSDKMYQQKTIDQHFHLLIWMFIYFCYTRPRTAQVEKSPFDLGEPEMTNHAVLMGIIYSMVKQDYVMQEKIVNSLNLKSLSGELESYCLMWSLRPFIKDEVMHHAWRLIH